jgi:catechol 2,3-dioxygenase-like lactoylglutathione lyase family enzyme
MPLKHVLGIDHVMVTVRDLDASAAAWKRLGFTVSPRGTHSPHLGSGNYTIMFGEDYIELLGILTETEHNKPMRDFLRTREGVERVAFTTDDAAAGVAELQARGIAADGPVHFGRPVELPGGRIGEAKFNVFRWPLDENPGGLRIFACQHLTRETVWVQEWQSHANGATRIRRIEVLTADPKAAAAHLSRLIDEPASQVEGGWQVPSGGKRADVLFSEAAAFARRYPQAARTGAPPDGLASVVLESADIELTKAALGAEALVHDGAVSVPASAANGIVVSFVPQ